MNIKYFIYKVKFSVKADEVKAGSEEMKKLILSLLVLTFFISASAYAYSDYNAFSPSWDFYYYHFNIIGYPVYNALLERYDFYDINDSYCGSLSYNPLLEKWEYFGL